MTKRNATAELSAIINRSAMHERLCAQLRAKYGKPVAGTAVVDLNDYVENDERRVVAEISKATEQRSRKLHLLIDSPGGLTTSMWRIVAAVESFKGRKIGVVVGRCSSAATAILAACDERVAPPTMELLIHCPGYYNNDQRYPYRPPRYTAKSLDREAARLADGNVQLANHYRARTGSTEFADMLASGDDHTISAAKARELSLLTAIEPAPPVYAAGSLSDYNFFRPNIARANVAVAGMARRAGFVAAMEPLKLHGDIGPNKPVNAAMVRKHLDKAPHARSLLVFFNSCGGDLEEAARIYALLAEHPAERKRAIASGDLQSAATVPFLACNVRSARPGTTILLHGTTLEPSASRALRWTAGTHRRAVDTLERANTMLCDLYAARTGYDRAFFAKEMGNDRAMQLVDALRCALIHSVEGLTRAPDPDWPAQVASAMRRGSAFGCPSYMFTQNYFDACQRLREATKAVPTTRRTRLLTP